MKKDIDYELPEPGSLRSRQSVELEIIAKTELGYKALIDDRYIGLIYDSEISQPLQPGQYLKGWVKTLRPDGKVDLSITQLDNASRDDLDNKILHYLNLKGGSAAISDKSSPEQIHNLFMTSKKNFKRAIGRLYKSQQILIEDDKISLVEGSLKKGSKSKSDKPESPWGKK